MPKSKKLTLTLTLTVTYDLHGADPEELTDNLRTVATDAIDRGVVTGEGPAEVESWSANIAAGGLTKSVQAVTPTKPTYEDTQDPETIALWLSRLPADASVHIDDGGTCLVRTGHDNTYLEIGGHTPERVPLNVDTFVDRLGSEGCEAIIPEVHYRLLCQETAGERIDEDIPCRLEKDDNPAFRMGCNDYADQMQKDRQWVTFDNGGSYYTADDVKTAIAAFDGDDDEYELAPELKSIVEWWL